MYPFDTRTQTRYASLGADALRHAFYLGGRGTISHQSFVQATIALATMHVQARATTKAGVWFEYEPSAWCARGFPLRRNALSWVKQNLDQVMMVRPAGRRTFVASNPILSACGVDREELMQIRIKERDDPVFRPTPRELPDEVIWSAAAFYVLGVSKMEFIWDIDRQQWFVHDLAQRIVSSASHAFQTESVACVQTALRLVTDGANTEAPLMQWYKLCPNHVEDAYKAALVADVSAPKSIRRAIIAKRKQALEEHEGEVIDAADAFTPAAKEAAL
jgi:hypothetical protein